MKRIGKLLLCSCALMLALVSCKSKSDKMPAPTTGSSAGLKVGVQTVQRTDIENRLSLSGTIAPSEQVMTFSKIAGRLVSVAVKEGDRVVEGQTLCLVNRDEPGQEFRDYQVTAPISGVVAKVNLDPGSIVAPSVPLIAIINTDRLKITLNVIEAELGSIRSGLAAQVTVPPYPDRVFTGSVTNILPMVDPMSRTAKVEVTLPNSGNLLKPGMSARVVLILGRHHDAVVIPKTAVIEKLGEKYVYRYDNGSARRANITTGYENADSVEVVSGITAGDKVIISDLNVLKDGTKVQEKSDTTAVK